MHLSIYPSIFLLIYLFISIFLSSIFPFLGFFFSFSISYPHQPICTCPRSNFFSLSFFLSVLLLFINTRSFISFTCFSGYLQIFSPLHFSLVSSLSFFVFAFYRPMSLSHYISVSVCLALSFSLFVSLLNLFFLLYFFTSLFLSVSLFLDYSFLPSHIFFDLL